MEEPYNHTINFTDLNQSSQQLIPSKRLHSADLLYVQLF